MNERINQVKLAIKAHKALNKGWSPTTEDVSKMIRAMFCPERRFIDVAYISRNGSRCREYSDAWSEALLGERFEIGSMCAEYPMTNKLWDQIIERRDHWISILFN